MIGVKGGPSTKSVNATSFFQILAWNKNVRCRGLPSCIYIFFVWCAHIRFSPAPFLCAPYSIQACGMWLIESLTESFIECAWAWIMLACYFPTSAMCPNFCRGSIKLWRSKGHPYCRWKYPTLCLVRHFSFIYIGYRKTERKRLHLLGFSLRKPWGIVSSRSLLAETVAVLTSLQLWMLLKVLTVKCEWHTTAGTRWKVGEEVAKGKGWPSTLWWGARCWAEPTDKTLRLRWISCPLLLFTLLRRRANQTIAARKI